MAKHALHHDLTSKGTWRYFGKRSTSKSKVKLHGPKLEFKDLMESESRSGSDLRLFFWLSQFTLMVNGDVTLSGHIVSAGRKRAFQIDRLP